MKKIMLLDDNPDAIEVTKMRLEKNNYSVIGFSDAKDFFEAVEKEMPDLVILDIVMRDMNGYQVCERLKQKKETENISIILLTGKELEPKGIAERCLDLGANAFLLKPVDSDVLLGKIKEIIGK